MKTVNTLKIPELDTVYVWTLFAYNGISKQSYYRYPYTVNGIARSSDNKQVHRYVKNYKDFSLLMVSFEGNKAKVEKFFNEQSKKIKVRPTPLDTLVRTEVKYE